MSKKAAAREFAAKCGGVVTRSAKRSFFGLIIIIAGQKYRYFKSRTIQGKIKTITVKRDTLGDIYIYLTCEDISNVVLTRTGNSVGFDFGLKTFLTASYGNDIASPLFFKQNVAAIKNANRELSRKQKGSNY